MIIDKISTKKSAANMIENIAKDMFDLIKIGGHIVSFGNGGSMCDAMHFASELSGRFCKNRPGMFAIAISDPSYITCAANDYGFENVFSHFLTAFVDSPYWAVALSTSGNSQNVFNAVDYALTQGNKVLFLSGNGGGEIYKAFQNHPNFYYVVFSGDDTATIQENSMQLLHKIAKLIDDFYFRSVAK